jgi:UDP-N-acetylmuramoylalanine--D-glutamate ligase
MKNFHRFLDALSGATLALCGLGLSNLPLIRFFKGHCAKIIACDRRDKSELSADVIKLLSNEGIELSLGENYINNIGADVIFRTPGMPFFSPELVRARNRGAIVTSEMEIFFDLCPCDIIAVTGSDGKSTTTSIISEMLKEAGRSVHLGGNIGRPLLPLIKKITAEDIAVVELSSFQLISMRRSPQIAVITNVSPNHLDIHKDMAEYIDAKKNIILHQNAFGRAVLNLDNSITNEFLNITRGRTFFFSASQKCKNGAFIFDKKIYFSQNGKEQLVMPANCIVLPGAHNLENYLAAVAALWGIVPKEIMVKVATEFKGLAHRTEFVRELHSVKYYNDSIATSPTRTIRGTLSLFPQKIILIAGGYDKNISFDELGLVVMEKVKILILMGRTAEKIERAVKGSVKYKENCLHIIRVNDMEEAVTVARSLSIPGDVVALSPACASFDLYTNFEARGDHFKQLVKTFT